MAEEEEWFEVEGEEEEVVEVLEDDDPPEAEEEEPPPPPEAEEPEVDRLCDLVSNALFVGFESHIQALIEARKRRQEALAFRSAVEEKAGEDELGGASTQTQDELDGMGVQLPTDKWRGDTNMRTLEKLLSRVDARGFERSAQQLEFHQAFMKAAARVIYRGDWETDRPMIMEKYGWDRCNSEVLISTPRRFGKTFRCAHAYIFHWCMCSLMRNCCLLTALPSSVPASRLRWASRSSCSHQRVVRPVSFWNELWNLSCSQAERTRLSNITKRPAGFTRLTAARA